MPSARLSPHNKLAALPALGVTLLSLPLVMGYWGELHPAFDSLTHFRVHLAVLVILLALPPLFFRGWRSIGAVAILLGLAAIASVTVPRMSGDAVAATVPGDTPQARYRLMHLNLRYDNRTPRQVLSLIGRTQADVVTLNEVSAMWRSELELINSAYPHRIVCSKRGIGGVAILSRRPFLHPSTAKCFNGGSLAIATVNLGGTTVDIAALHLSWPWPFGQPRQIGPVAQSLQRLGRTAILAGDLNAVPWSVTARRVAEAGGFQVLGDIGPTWLARPLPNLLRRTLGLPIDNIFVKGGVVPLGTTRLDHVGSDHLPVMLEFSLKREPIPTGVMQAELGQ